MKAKVNEECIGCGLCASTCSEVFEMGGDVAVVIQDPVLKENEECTIEAKDLCPTDAIEVQE